MPRQIRNPITGCKIQVGGATYKKLVRDGFLKQKGGVNEPLLSFKNKYLVETSTGEVVDNIQISFRGAGEKFGTIVGNVSYQTSNGHQFITDLNKEMFAGEKVSDFVSDVYKKTSRNLGQPFDVFISNIRQVNVNGEKQIAFNSSYDDV